MHNYERIFLGIFPPTPEGEIEAARTYDRQAIELGWPASGLNFPIEDYLGTLVA
jgi:hypothetical protein